MVCGKCGRGSMHRDCPFCRKPAIITGFDPTDIFNPFGLGYSAGQSMKEGGISGAAKDAASSVSTLATTAKWAIIGGMVLAGGVVVYSLVKFLPKALDVAASNAKEAGRAGVRIAERAV